jgi:hypothetical protein
MRLAGGPGDHDVGQLAAQPPVRSFMAEPAAGDKHGQQVRDGGDDVIVQPPRCGQVLQILDRLGELQAAVEEHHRDVRVNLASEVDDDRGILPATPGHEPVVLVEVRSDPVEQLLVDDRAAPARGDAAQRLKVQARRQTGHCSSVTVTEKLGNSRSRYSRTYSIASGRSRIDSSVVVLSHHHHCPDRLKPNGGGTSGVTWARANVRAAPTTNHQSRPPKMMEPSESAKCAILCGRLTRARHVEIDTAGRDLVTDRK